jgi:hypothetical protein
VAADVSGDGKADLICANYLDSTLTVLVNNGSGGFTVASSPGVGVNPVAVAAADVNGDNKVDLITASFGSITILTNNGSGGFATVTNMWAGSTPVSVVAADLNGDGRADLAVANRIAYRVTVLLNEPRFQGSVAGDGGGLTGLNASQLASGTLADTRLSANVTLLDTEQTFTAAKSWGVGSQLSTDGNGAIELGPPSGSGQQPFIDFHYGTGSAQDFNVRMINDGNGQLSIYAPALLTRFSTTSMAINTAASISGNNTLEFGAGFASKEPNAGKIGYQTWSPDALDIVGAGTTSTSRKVKFYAEGGTTFNGSVEVPNLVAVSANPYTSPQLAISQLNTADHARLQIGVSTFPQWTLAVSPGASPQLLFWNGTANVAWLNYDGTFNAAGDVYARGVKLTSDRNAKENFQPVNPQTVLDKVAALPISQWNFKTAPGETHIGPMAQDFYAAFSTGSDEKHIATVDADGVALAAIQGLNQKLTEELKRRDAENAELKRRLEVLERILRAQKPN